MIQNEIVLEKDSNILSSTYHGDQTRETIQKIAEATKPLINDLRAAKKKVLILVNVADIKKQTAGARKEVLDQLNFLDYDKLAIYGANLFIKQIIDFLIVASGKQAKVKYFETEKEARTWLMN